MVRGVTGDDYREVTGEIIARGVEWEMDPTLDRIRDLLSILGDPQHACPIIHVTGTNGKTSTARLIEGLLRERGLRTGVYTSPHLVEMRERIRIDGAPIGEELFTATYRELAPYLELIDGKHANRLSFFEVLTAMAYAAFADAPVDVAVIEVGIGGSWDATNVTDAAVAVVTPISLDHAADLGGTIESIATEKSGIIKPGSVAVLARQPQAAAEVLLRRVAEAGAELAREGVEFGVLNRELGVGGQLLRLQGLHGVYDQVFLPLFGVHQAANAACALAAVEAFAGGGATPGGDVSEATRIGGAHPIGPDGTDTGSGEYATGTAGDGGELSPALVRDAFAKAASPGRLEVVRTGPTVLVDGAHNPAGMAAAVAALVESFGFTRLVGVLAVAADKDVVGMLEELEPVLAELVVTRNSSPRSMTPEELADLAEGVFGADRVHVEPRLDDALDRGLTLAEETGEFQGAGLLVTGSVITAGDARTLLRVGE